MTLWTKDELIAALGSELITHNLSPNIMVDEVVIDSRKVAKHKLFIALNGDNHDAHRFLKQVFENDCELAIIHRKDDFDHFSSSNVILVKDTFRALYKLAEFSRDRSDATIIAVTGSVGKTSTKEMLKAAFQTQGKTFATPGNLNNHIGLPLCLANFSSDFDYGIFEMGMNHLGEIQPLSDLTKPDIAIITNIGPVHIENFKDENEIALAKSEIFSGLSQDGLVLINRDNSHFDFLQKQAKKIGIADDHIMSFGENEMSDYKLMESIITSPYLSQVKVKTKDENVLSYIISTSHKASIFNSIIVISCLDLLGQNIESGIESFKHIQNAKGRGEIIEAECDGKKITIIDDSYNASLPSMQAGLEYALNLKNALNKNRVVVALGDMLELGKESGRIHQAVIQTIEEHGIDFSILIGKQMQLTSNKMDKNIYKIFSDSENASLVMKDILRDGDILYVKGSRGMKMEKIIESII